MAAADDEHEIARPGAGDEARIAAGGQLRENLLGGEALVGQRLAEPCAQLVGTGARSDGAVCDTGEVGLGETVGDTTRAYPACQRRARLVAFGRV